LPMAGDLGALGSGGSAVRGEGHAAWIGGIADLVDTVRSSPGPRRSAAFGGAAPRDGRPFRRETRPHLLRRASGPAVLCPTSVGTATCRRNRRGQPGRTSVRWPMGERAAERGRGYGGRRGFHRRDGAGRAGGADRHPRRPRAARGPLRPWPCRRDPRARRPGRGSTPPRRAGRARCAPTARPGASTTPGAPALACRPFPPIPGWSGCTSPPRPSASPPPPCKSTSPPSSPPTAWLASPSIRATRASPCSWTASAGARAPARPARRPPGATHEAIKVLK
jgi:hypothetical protein